MSCLLQDSFTITLLQKPFLAGSLEKEEIGPKAGRFKVTYADGETQKLRKQFWVNDLGEGSNVWRYTYHDLRKKGMPVSGMVSHILGPSVALDWLATLPIAAQANFIPGGCLLYICLSHSMFDGFGGAMIIGAWSENCWMLQQHSNSHLFTGHVRRTPSDIFSLPGLLQYSTAPQGEDTERILQEVSLWHLLGLRKPPVDRSISTPSPPSEPLISAIFTASRESVACLKSSCNSHQVNSQTRAHVSSFEAIAALLRRCIIRARCTDSRRPDITKTHLRIPVNLRKALKIHQTYPGNVLLNSITEMPLTALVTEKNVCNIASMIHSSIWFSRNPDVAKDAIKLSFVLPAPSLRYPLFWTTTAQDLVLTRWQYLPFLEQMWGLAFGLTGQPEFIRIPYGNLPGICALLPRKKEGGSDVLISLYKAHS